MSEIAKLLRLASLADKEIATHTLNIAAQISGELFTSQLSAGFTRKSLCVYNNSDTASGESYVGPSGVTPADGMILEKGKWLEIRIASGLDIYFVAGGAGCELRVLELA